MSSIGLWRDENFEIVADIALVRTRDVEVFRTMVLSKEIVTPQKLFVVAPNGYGSEDILALYLLWKNGWQDSHSMLVPNCAASVLFKSWHSLVTSLESFDFAGANATINGLKGFSLPLATRWSRVLQIIERYLDTCVRPLANGAVYRTYDANTRRLWWREPVDLLKSISEFGQSLSGGLTVEMPGVARLKEVAEAARAALVAHSSRQNTDEKFYDLSAYCLGLAKRASLAGQHNSAFLLVYRSMDLYFQSVALAEHVMVETTNDVAYRHVVEDVHLVTTERQLVATEKLLVDGNRQEFLARINRIRNQVLEIHGAHSVTDAEAATCIERCAAVVGRIEGGTRWIRRADGYFPKLNGGIDLFFDAVPDIGTYLEEQAV